MYSNHIPSPSNGSPTHFFAWNAFVRLILEITLEAYDRMLDDKRINIDFEEDAITAILVDDYLNPLISRKNLAILAILQPPVYSEEMKSGRETTRKARKIDIKIVTFGQHDIYFTWECKRICENKFVQNSETSQTDYLTYRYSVDGIARFIDEDYSANLDDAGMIGYVINGKTTTIVNEINASMLRQKNRTWSTNDALKHSSALGSFEDIYESRHLRVKSKTYIRLHHLFFRFDWK